MISLKTLFCQFCFCFYTSLFPYLHVSIFVCCQVCMLPCPQVSASVCFLVGVFPTCFLVCMGQFPCLHISCVCMFPALHFQCLYVFPPLHFPLFACFPCLHVSCVCVFPHLCVFTSAFCHVCVFQFPCLHVSMGAFPVSARFHFYMFPHLCVSHGLHVSTSTFSHVCVFPHLCASCFWVFPCLHFHICVLLHLSVQVLVKIIWKPLGKETGTHKKGFQWYRKSHNQTCTLGKPLSLLCTNGRHFEDY